MFSRKYIFISGPISHCYVSFSTLIQNSFEIRISKFWKHLDAGCRRKSGKKRPSVPFEVSVASYDTQLQTWRAPWIPGWLISCWGISVVNPRTVSSLLKRHNLFTSPKQPYSFICQLFEVHQQVAWQSKLIPSSNHCILPRNYIVCLLQKRSWTPLAKRFLEGQKHN